MGEGNDHCSKVPAAIKMLRCWMLRHYEASQPGNTICRWSMNKKSLRHKLGMFILRENTNYLGWKKKLLPLISKNPYARRPVTPFSGKKSQLFFWVTCPSITCFNKVIPLSTASCLCDCLYMVLQMFYTCRLVVKPQTHSKSTNSTVS